MPDRFRAYTFPKPGKKAPKFCWRYMQLEVAKEWGLTPSQWDNVDIDGRAEMLAFNHVQNLHKVFLHEESKSG